jgi:hypothetical protein
MHLSPVYIFRVLRNKYMEQATWTATSILASTRRQFSLASDINFDWLRLCLLEALYAGLTPVYTICHLYLKRHYFSVCRVLCILTKQVLLGLSFYSFRKYELTKHSTRSKKRLSIINKVK